MPGKPYPPAKRAEAVALARVMGADAAAAELGMPDARPIRRWLAEAGDAPELQADPGTWRALLDVAMARTMAAVTSGRVSAATVATIAGIAARNVSRDPKPPEPTPEDGIVPLERILEQERPDLRREDLGRIVSLALNLLHEAGKGTRTDEDVAAWMDTMRRWWRGEIPATDIPRASEPEPPRDERPFPEWFAEFVRTVDLDADEAAYEERERERRAVYARQQAAIAAMWAEILAKPAIPPDPDVAALLAEVDQYLETHR